MKSNFQVLIFLLILLINLLAQFRYVSYTILDHALIIEAGSLKKTTYKALKDEQFRIIEFDFRPTAENLAKYLYEQMKESGYQVRKLTVYETPNNCASYTEV